MSAGLLAVNVVLVAALCAVTWLLASRRREPGGGTKSREQALQHQLLHDEVTKLPNRTLFHDRLERALARSVRRRSGCAVLALDLDRFKLINDSLGTALGDALLRESAARLDTCLRPEDTVARTSGDEFMVLLESAGTPREAVAVADRIAEALAPPFEADGHELFLSASIGIAFGRGGRDRAEDVLQNAGVAVHRAKDGGGGRYELFRQEMSPHPMERLSLENDLRRALEREELFLEYQPRVDLVSGRVVALEALLRWRHPQRGSLEAHEFVPVAEETGLILAIGRWALKRACEQAAAWPGTSPPQVCVDISARQLQQPRLRLMNEVATVLANSGLDASRLCLEVSERAVMHDADAAVAAMRDLKKLGVLLTLERFGEGNTSLGQLRRLPLDVVQVDRSFLAELADGSEGQAIVRALVEVCHALGLPVVADGVDRADQVPLLRELGCDLAQGRLFSAPLSQGEAAELVASGGRLEAALNSA
ncbi:MAG TPA: EAL domain-containing protein [Thermoleophilaceae bacterium]|nr:EAL domain-containing protein [Thermoleophilaceae bacterium]